MRVLVTGAAGFIGSNLAHALVGSGHEVTIVDDLSTGKAANIHPRAAFHRLDILDPALAEVVAEASPEAVVHLAAQVDVQTSIADPEADRRVNVDGTRAVAEAAAAAGVRRVLSASSAAVYGDQETVPIPETADKRPMNPYGESKLAAESALAETLRPAGVDFASLRFSNVYGPRQDARAEGGVVAIYASRAQAGEPLVVFGDGRQTRDFIYVGDVVGAILAALACEDALAAEGADGPAYNVSTGEQTSVLELASVVRRHSRLDRENVYEPARPGDIGHSALDPSKAQRALGWSARASLDTGLGRTLQWFRDDPT